jgi:cell division protein FtsB
MQIKNWIEPVQNKVQFYLQRMSDIRFVGQIVFVVLVLLISWSGVKSIQTNYNLQKQISALRQQNAVQKLQNDNLALQNQYLNSNQYLELSSRQNLGLADPGETEVLVPASVAKAYETNLPSLTQSDVTKTKQPAYQRNFQSWVDFFLHRQNVTN